MRVYINVYIHFFFLELAVVVVVEGRCENNNLSRMFVYVSGDMLRSYYRRGRQRTHYSFLLLHFFLYYPTAITTTTTRLHCFLDDARTLIYKIIRHKE